MYSRNFYPSEINQPPENYVGTAFLGGEAEDTTVEKEPAKEPIINENNSEENVPAMGKETSGTLFGLPGLSSLLKGNIFERSFSFLSDIKTEEILIITVAAFLLFSKDGDTECAILLILLLFVK